MPRRNVLAQDNLRVDPALVYKYYVEIEGVFVAAFTECSGLEVERDVKTYEEGGVNNFVHQLPGRVKYRNVHLKRGITYTRALWDWFQEGAFDGRVKRVNLSIVLGNAEGFKVQQWNALGAYPIRYRGPGLRADSNDAAVEEIELAHQGLELAEVGQGSRTPLART